MMNRDEKEEKNQTIEVYKPFRQKKDEEQTR